MVAVIAHESNKCKQIVDDSLIWHGRMKSQTEGEGEKYAGIVEIFLAFIMRNGKQTDLSETQRPSLFVVSPNIRLLKITAGNCVGNFC